MRVCVRIVLVTVYVKKEEEKAYHAVMLDTLTTYNFKMEVKYCCPCIPLVMYVSTAG